MRLAANHWQVADPHAEAAAMAARLDVHPAIAAVLIGRGLRTPEAIASFLNPSLDSLESPFAFRDMRKAVDRIRLAISRGEKILVYGDYDVDGVTGSSILYPVLRQIGANADVYIPHRVNEGYGLNLEALSNLVEKGYTLFITVDNGITGVSQIQFLADKGLDVIIVDHHVPKEGLPPAFAIVSACVGGGDANMAACGLAFKTAWALTGDLEGVKHHLDLVALGTIADVAPLVGDNRALVKHGLRAIAETKKPGLKALMDVSRVSKQYLNYRDIGFSLAPRINAAGRMASPEAAFRLLTTTDETEAVQLAKQLDEGNRERQKVEAQTYEEAREKVESEADYANEKVIVVESAQWHEGVLGIVASRLVERFHKPSIVISHRSGVGKGSGRSIAAFSLFDTVLQCEGFLENFGGHAQACGLTIKKENILPFRQKLNEAAERMEALGIARKIAIDAELPFAQIDLKFLKDLERVAPFGAGNAKPLFLSRDVRIKGIPKKLGKDTLQCWVSSADGRTTCEMIGFRSYGRWMEETPACTQVDIVHRPALKEFKGIASIQLELEDWKTPLQASSMTASAP